MSVPRGDNFFVGGRYVTDPDSQEVMVGQMYVRRHGEPGGGGPAIVLLHGGGQTGAHFEQTPDGRLGLAQLLAGHGCEVYVVDLPGVGRSGYYEPEHGRLVHYSAALTEAAFTASSQFGLWPQAALHTAWPGSGRRGDPTFDAFYASQTGRIIDDRANELAVRAAGVELVEWIGACYLLTHSQSGPFGWQIADGRPDLVRGIVALEPKGPPYLDVHHASSPYLARPFGITVAPLTYEPPLTEHESLLPYETEPGNEGTAVPLPVHHMMPPRRFTNLSQVPVLLVTGEASHHANYDHLTVDFLRDGGVPVTPARLEAHGIHGNGHLMALERNNAEIAEFIATWLSRTALSPSAG